MASIKKINSRKYKITVSNGYRLDGRKISRAKTICVPATVHPRSIQQYVAHEAEEFERQVKNGFGEDAETPFEEYADSWLKRQTKLAPGTLAMYTRMLKVAYQYIGQMLSILASFAQEESASLSRNIKWTVQKKYQEGRVHSHQKMLGYDWVDGEMVVNEAEAETVRLIFEQYIDGKSTGQIAKELAERGIKSVRGKPFP